MRPTSASPDELARFTDAALHRGALQPIATDQITTQDAGVPFVIKWMSSATPRPHPSKPARGGHHNPFLPPDPALTLGPLAPAHVVLLNKYPVMAHHLLIVTREFEAQTDPLGAGDFAALAAVMRTQGGLGFYNGGYVAGASQPHKHVQWIPALPPMARVLPALLADPSVALRFRHAFAPLNAGHWAPGDRGAALAACYRECLARLDIAPDQAPLRPYNLLVTRGWMWLIPRRAEHWNGMSINALGFAGSLFIKSSAELPALQAAGPLNALRTVAEPA